MCTVQAPQSAMPQPNFVPVSCRWRSEEHTSELQSRSDLVCRLLLEKKKKTLEIGRANASTPATIRSHMRSSDSISDVNRSQMTERRRLCVQCLLCSSIVAGRCRQDAST